MKTIAERVRNILENHPLEMFDRAALRGRIPGAATAAIVNGLKSSERMGVITRISRGKYQWANQENKKNLKEQLETEAGVEKRPYKRKNIGPTGDAIIYLNHARRAMKNQDSPEYMLVSLALYTLQGKI